MDDAKQHQHADGTTRTAMQNDPHHATRNQLELEGGARVLTKPGVHGYPEMPPGVRELTPFVRDLVSEMSASEPVVIDASGSAGALTAVALAVRDDLKPTVLEPSAAALTCARELLSNSEAEIRAGVVWDALRAAVVDSSPAGSPDPAPADSLTADFRPAGFRPAGFRPADSLPMGSRPADLIVLLPPADRGSERVRAELAAAVGALSAGGMLLLAVHKDRGGKRYLRDAERWFGSVETIGRAKGWRIGLARAPDAASDSRDGDGGRGAGFWLSFEAAGHTFMALPGVFAAGKLDPGTRILLDAMESQRAGETLAGKRVLDLGCGYGALSVWAATAGAHVTAIDDDVAAVRSTRRSAGANGVAVAAVHSDLDAALKADTARFDVVLCNPPFHVGKQVRLDLSQAFVRTAHRRLVPGGVLWLVANRALPYEQYLDGWPVVETVQVEGGFKVLRAQR